MSNEKVNIIADFIYTNPQKDNINEVLAEFGGIWRKKKRTFERLLPKARELNIKRLQGDEKVKDDTRHSEIKKVVKKAIKSRDELLEIYSNEMQRYVDVMSGKKSAKRIGNAVIVPTFSDVIKAGVEISKMQGYYDPIKTNNKLEIKNPFELLLLANGITENNTDK